MIYITCVDLLDKGYFGIAKKIKSQIFIFKKFFGKVYLTFCSGQMICLMEDNRIIDKELAITRAMCYTVIAEWLDRYKIKRTYIRYNFSDKWFLQFLKIQKAKGVKTVLEIPTYPYDGEITSERIRLEDGYYREQLDKYIDIIATNVNQKRVWNIPCIKLVNGVDLDANPLQEKTDRTDRILMIAVSTLVDWQGYERILEGLYQFYKNDTKYKLLFKIVGGGPEMGNYQALTKMYGLEHCVEFCGKLEGKELDQQYAQADIAVSSLGRYKSGVNDFSPIKAAEYCARGIPFICGYHDIRFRGDEKFILNVPNSPGPIDMNCVTAFYEKISSCIGYQEEMRKYAVDHLSWDVVMRPIIDVLQ